MLVKIIRLFYSFTVFTAFCSTVNYAAPLPLIRVNPVGTWEYVLTQFEEVVLTLEIYSDGVYLEKARCRKNGFQIHTDRIGRWKFCDNTLVFVEVSGFHEYFRIHAKSDKNTLYTHWTNDAGKDHPTRVDLKRIK